MKLYVAFIVVLCGCLAEKEVPEEYASLLTDRLIQEIKKSLSDYPDDDADGTAHKVHQQQVAPVNSAKSSCDFSIVVGQIIKTHDSIKAGAVYIDAPASKTRDSCGTECCSSKQRCDLAVFKDKGDEHACYLFQCNGVCLFTNHTGFSTMSRRRMPQQHEADLAGLATSPPTTTTSSTTTTTTVATTTTSTSTAATTTRKSPLIKKEPAALFGACQEDTDCAGSGTECLAGYCVCKEGYHAQEGICRKDCSRFQFECANEGKPLTYPQCIAIYDTCDGIPHCRDASDEFNCPSSTTDKQVLPGRKVGSEQKAGAGLDDSQVASLQQQVYPDIPVQQLAPSWQQQFLQQQQLLGAGFPPQQLLTPQQIYYNTGQHQLGSSAAFNGFSQPQLPLLQQQQQLVGQPQIPPQLAQSFLNGPLGTDVQQGDVVDRQKTQQVAQQQSQQHYQQPLHNQQLLQQQQQQQQLLPQQKQQQQQQQQNSASQQPGPTQLLPAKQRQMAAVNAANQLAAAGQMLSVPKTGIVQQGPLQAAPNQVQQQQKGLLEKERQQSQGGGREVDYPVGRVSTQDHPNGGVQPPQLDMRQGTPSLQRTPPIHAQSQGLLPIKTQQPQQPQQQSTQVEQDRPAENRGASILGRKTTHFFGSGKGFDPNTGLLNSNAVTKINNNKQINSVGTGGLVRLEQQQQQQQQRQQQNPEGQVNYSDGGYILSNSNPASYKGAQAKPPMDKPNGAGSQSESGMNRGWLTQQDVFKNPKTELNLGQQQYLPKSEKVGPQHGFRSYAYETNPYQQGYPNYDQFYAYSDPEPKPHSDYDYQYAIAPADFVDPLDNIVEELLMEVLNHLPEQVDREAVSAGQGGTADGMGSRPGTDSATRGSADSADSPGSLWDYYDSSNYVPWNGPKGRPKPVRPENANPRYQPENGHLGGNGLNRARPPALQRPKQTQGGATTGQRWNQNDGGPKESTLPKGRVDASLDSSNRAGHPAQLPKQKVPEGENHQVSSPGKPVEAPSQVSAVRDKITPSKNDALPSTVGPPVKTMAPETAKPPAKVEEKDKNINTEKKNVASKPLTGGSRMSGQTSPAVNIEEINEAETETRSPMKANKTAVVVLALGLAVTAVLLMFVGCRLRMVKRRLRRGRPLNSNEADYLINGMYL